MSSRVTEDVSDLFICFCEVAQPSTDKPAWVITTFPDINELKQTDKDTLNTLPKFVYPCTPSEGSTVLHYSFVLTNAESKWTFGFCRHDPKTGTALAFLSLLPWHEVFMRILNTAADLIRDCEAKELTDFLQFLMKHDLRDPGEKFIVQLNHKLGVFECMKPAPHCLPSIPESRNLTEYYSAVDTNNMLVIFASMLYERRIVFKSRKLHRLSACVQAANTVLYPMNWQHIFIPILPKHLAEYLWAPMPFLIGVPSSIWETVNRSEIGEVVVLDADNNTLETPFQDVSSLPIDVVKFLRTNLSNQPTMIEDGFARTFLKALVQLIGGYRDALKFQQGEKITFCEKAFVESRPPSMQAFLRDMLKLQLFQQFIDERLNMLNAGLGFSDEFEFEACNYMAKSSTLTVNEQYKDWVTTMKKQSSAFFKSVKNKANPAMKSAVKSVKDRGKDVKSAYKGIKTRMKKDAGSSHHHHQSSTFHAARPLTIGAPVSAAATFKRQRATSSVVTSRSNEYFPLDSPEGATSPPNEEDLPAPQLDMNLLGDLQDLINRQCTVLDRPSPPVDRTLKPVRSTDSLRSDSSSPHHPLLSRSSLSLPLSSPDTPSNPFSFSFTKQGPLMTDPFGFLANPGSTTTPYYASDSAWNPFAIGGAVAPMSKTFDSLIAPVPKTFYSHIAPVPKAVEPLIVPMPKSVEPLIIDLPCILPPPPSVTATSQSKCNGSADLIRLDSVSSSHKEEPLSREDSTDSIKFKTGLMNPLYPYYSPTESPKRSMSSDTVPLQPSNGLIHHNSTNIPAIPSFLHPNPDRKPNNNLTKQENDLLMEYGLLDLENKSSTGTNYRSEPLDPFELPSPPSKTISQNAQSSWTTFE